MKQISKIDGVGQGSRPSARAIARQVRERRRDPADAALEALARLSGDARLHAMIHVDTQANALEHAERVAARLASGIDLPLAGVPFVVSDNIAIDAMPSSGGSWQLRRHFSRNNAASVALLMAAGAIPVGKANLHELAFGATSANAGFGAVLNPHDSSRIAGGSSGGSAVAVRRAVPLALGTDMDGSIRIPAAFCGVHGFRPSAQRYSDDGIMAPCPTRDSLGTMANSVQDLLLVDAVLTGARPLASARVSLSGLRIGVPRRPYFEGLDDAISDAVENALTALADAGASIIDVDATALAQHDDAAGFVISACEARAAWSAYSQNELGMSLTQFSRGITSADVRDAFVAMAAGPLFQKSEYLAALSRRDQIKRWYSMHFGAGHLDCLLLPTTVCEAPLLADSRHDDPAAPVKFAHLIRQASPATLGGIPSVALPLGRSPRTGMPLSLMCEGPAGGDRRLLAIAMAIETSLDFVDTH